MKNENIDYGPLTALIGHWYSDNGQDVSPEPNDTERNSYREELSFSPVGSVTNAEEQVLVALHYRQQIWRTTNGKPLHEQTGYWIWDAANQSVMQTLTIPRGVCITAMGSHEARGEGFDLNVRAAENEGITQPPFMQEKANTKAYQLNLRISANEIHYQQTTTLDIYGREFLHTDECVLTRVLNTSE